MAIFGNYKDNYDTATAATNNSMGFDLSAIQSCTQLLLSKFEPDFNNGLVQAAFAF